MESILKMGMKWLYVKTYFSWCANVFECSYNDWNFDYFIISFVLIFFLHSASYIDFLVIPMFKFPCGDDNGPIYLYHGCSNVFFGGPDKDTWHMRPKWWHISRGMGASPSLLKSFEIWFSKMAFQGLKWHIL